MILPDNTTPLPPEDDIPPFSAPPTCPSCDKPWQDHQGVSSACKSLQTAILALKAAAVQTYAIHDTLRKIVANLESPQTEKYNNPNISDLLDDMEL